MTTGVHRPYDEPAVMKMHNSKCTMQAFSIEPDDEGLGLLWLSGL